MTESPFRAWDLFLLRTPLVAVDERPIIAARPPRNGRPAYLDLLATIGERPDLRSALALATPQLSRVLDKVAVGATEKLTTAQLRRAALALLRYDIRSRTRPTPFGLFAGVTFGRFDSSPKLEWTGQHRTRTHMDMDWLLALVHELENLQDDVLPHLRLSANSGLTVRAGRVWLDTPPNLGISAGAQGRTEVSVRLTPVVAQALAAARSPLPYPALAAQLHRVFPAATGPALTRLLDTLVQQELLLTDLRPPLDGTDPLDHVVTILDRVHRASGHQAGMLAAMRQIAELRSRVDEQPPSEGAEPLAALTAAARTLRPHETPLHIDTHVGARVHLPELVRADVERAADLLWRLSPPRLGMRPLRRYHEAFLDRFGVGRLVPLFEVLDASTGLGAPAGYGWPRSEAPAPAPEAVGGGDLPRDRLLAAIAMDAVRDGRREVILDDSTLARLAPQASDPVDLPASCELYLHLVAPTIDALAEGRFRLVIAPNPGSHQAGATLARFADLDPEAGAEIAAILHATIPQVDGSLPVNLAYLPRTARAANIAHTASYTGRRIRVGLPPSADAEEIPLTDIAVGATLDRLFAVHLPTGQEITPVAHNMMSPAAQAPNVARLLWEIGQEGHRLWEPWNWGPIAAAPFMPRVRYGRIVLLPATWKLDSLRDGGLRDHTDNADDRWNETLGQWRSSWAVPRHVLALSSDQRLLLDLDDPWHQQLLRDELGKDEALVVQELPGGEFPDGWLHDGRGPHVAEIVVPLTRRPGYPLRPPSGARPSPADRRTPRQRRDGEEWLYVRLYGSRSRQDDLLRLQLPSLLTAVSELGMDRWFFIRYSDPDGHHLRLRLHARPDLLWAAVLPAVTKQINAWQDDSIAGHYLIDEYDPELERYGGPQALAAAEHAFEADSAAALTLLDLAASPDVEYDLDTLAAISVTSLCHSFGPPSPAKWVPAETVGDPAAAWLSTTGPRQPLTPRHRRNAQRWRRLLDPVGGWPELSGTATGQGVLDALYDRNRTVTRFAATIRALTAAGTCPTPEVRIVGSLLHMTCNRLFGGYPEREADTLALARAAVWDNLNRRRHT